MNVYVRKMKEADIHEVRWIYTLGWQNAFKGIVPQDYLDQMDLSEWAPPPEGAYVLTDGKKCLGTSSISKARDKSFNDWGEIISIYVLPELIGKGYGHILFEYVKDVLLEQGYKNIYLTVFEKNQRARSFYEKHGFVWIGEKLSISVGGKELVELRYVLCQ